MLKLVDKSGRSYGQVERQGNLFLACHVGNFGRVISHGWVESEGDAKAKVERELVAFQVDIKDLEWIDDEA